MKSKRKPISQREARALKRRMEQLERCEEMRRNSYALDYPGGTYIGSLSVASDDLAAVKTARKLKHAVVCTTLNGAIQLYALPIAKGDGHD